jgi:peroxiredoxin
MNCPYCDGKLEERKRFNEKECFTCNLLWKGTGEIYRKTGVGMNLRGLQRISPGTLIIKNEQI